MPRSKVTRRRRHLTQLTTGKNWQTHPITHSISAEYYRRELDKPAYKPYSLERLNEEVSNLLQGDVRSRDEIIKHCLYFAVSLAYKYAGGHVPVSDLFQCASLGLTYAVDDARKEFKPEAGSFLTYLANYIYQQLYNSLGKERTIVSSNSSAETVKVRSAKNVLFNKLEREPTIEEIATYTKLSQDDVVTEILRAQNDGLIYLEHAPSIENPRGRSLLEVLPSDHVLRPDEEVQTKDELIYYRALVDSAMAYLGKKVSTRDYNIFCLYYGLTASGLSKSIIDIAPIYGFTKQRCDQILKRIWRDKRMCKTMNSQWFKAVLKHIAYLHERLGERVPIMNFFKEPGTES